MYSVLITEFYQPEEPEISFSPILKQNYSWWTELWDTCTDLIEQGEDCMNRRPQSVGENEALELSFPGSGETKNGVAFPSIMIQDPIGSSQRVLS